MHSRKYQDNKKMRARYRCLAWVVGILLFPPAHLFIYAQVATREEALAAAYPGAEIHAERIFLTQRQQEKAELLGGVQIASALIARYCAHKDGRVVGRAYLDTHQVRTKKESLLICLDETGTVKRIEVTAFREPSEYLAKPAWFRQYSGRRLNKDLNLNRAIRPVAGATLTARAANQAVRRVLAIDQSIQQKCSGGINP